jgi:hypothetical protein
MEATGMGICSDRVHRIVKESKANTNDSEPEADTRITEAAD